MNKNKYKYFIAYQRETLEDCLKTEKRINKNKFKELIKSKIYKFYAYDKRIKAKRYIINNLERNYKLPTWLHEYKEEHMTPEELQQKYKDYIKITIINKDNKSKHEYILDLNKTTDILIGKKIREQTTFKATKLNYKDMLELEEWEKFIKNECEN